MPSVSSAQPTAVLPSWNRVYNYTSEDCVIHTCRKCLYEVSSASPPNHVPSAPPLGAPTDDHVWVTPNFFRFQEEAQRYLALPPWNKAQRGLYLNIDTALAGILSWRLCQAGLFPERPGGALEYEYVVNSRPWQPLPVDEVFQTISIGSTKQPSGTGSSSDFHFDKI